MSTLSVYIDGYNWYHAIFKHHPEWKWLDVQRFFQVLQPHDTLIKVKMFSALIDPHNQASDARERQQRYFRALGTLPTVEVILGAFQKRDVTCAQCKCRYSIDEEKKTDVNIAVHLMADAIGELTEKMIVVSGDSDIQPAVEWVATQTNVKVAVLLPALPQEQSTRRTDYYRTKKLPVECKFLPLDCIKNCQFPNVVRLQGNTLAIRPHAWASPAVQGLCKREPGSGAP